MIGPLPSDLSRRIAAFCAAGYSGRVIVHIRDGRVMGGELCEEWRVPRAAGSELRKGVDR